MPPVRDLVHGINDRMPPGGARLPGPGKHEVMAAAEAVDRKAGSLPALVVEAILAVLPRTLMRAIHRRQHLDQIEHALAA